MAAVPITINGIQTDENGSRNVTIVGMASLTGLGVGGGPVQPPSIWPSPGHPAHPIAPGGPPPGIWPGPGPLPHPEHPIVIPPGKPDVPPPSVWPGPGVPPEGTAPLPEHPIVLPPPGNPIAPGTLINWKAVWTEDKGWFIVGVPNVPHPAPG